ncbi:MAG: hypothetical protein M3336_02850, partial [Chloroflexota bacterium]|nr:hypothetical protein [Chloroflexota bacterium]
GLDGAQRESHQIFDLVGFDAARPSNVIYSSWYSDFALGYLVLVDNDVRIVIFVGAHEIDKPQAFLRVAALAHDCQNVHAFFHQCRPHIIFQYRSNLTSEQLLETRSIYEA